jgi:hypothetical protein
MIRALLGVIIMTLSLTACSPSGCVYTPAVGPTAAGVALPPILLYPNKRPVPAYPEPVVPITPPQIRC